MLMELPLRFFLALLTDVSFPLRCLSEKQKKIPVEGSRGIFLCVSMWEILQNLAVFCFIYYLIKISHAKLSLNGGQMAELTCFFTLLGFTLIKLVGKDTHPHAHTHIHTALLFRILKSYRAIHQHPVRFDLQFEREREKKREGVGGGRKKKGAQGKSGVRAEGGGENVIDRHGETERDVTSIRSLSC